MGAGTGLAGLATAAALVVGCGSGGGTPRAAGAALFDEDCGACHSLTGRQSPRRQGGDLLALRMSRADMLEFVREMPVPHRLNSSQMQTIAEYVRGVEARGS